ncbi:MAG: hypothetical protein H8M99_14940 [Gloeobacteraceae cyanobacterium ES-bin-144]|nr:hypothetical protein [Verrucomicrobiales bacterium]
MNIDWPGTALKIGSGRGGGTDVARNAISEILGSEAITGAVEHYITYIDGSELARSVLGLLRPKVAMDYCMKIYREDDHLRRRQSSIELLRNIGDRRAFEWVPELLNDPDPTIQTWGASMVDELLFAGYIEADDCVKILVTMSEHSNPGVQRYHELILEFLSLNEDNSEQAVTPNGP